MIDDLYSTQILTLAANLPHAGRLPLPHGTGEQVAKLCGSKAVIDVRIDHNGDIIEFAQDVKACALGQAAASLVGEVAIGASLQDVREARDDMLAMLKHGGEGPEGRFERLKALKVVSGYPARQASTMVALEALVKAHEAALTLRIDSCVLGWEAPDEPRLPGEVGPQTGPVGNA